MPTTPVYLLRAALLVSLGSAAALAWQTYHSVDSWPKHEALQADLSRVLQDNAAVQAKVDSIRREIVAQKERPEVQEALVRDLLGYVRPEDIVLRPRR